LAGGEFGWAVDTQALYIGNGSVSEGAPAVGNTKILTEHDNLFELSSTYIYGDENLVQTGATPGAPVQRTLKERLDDAVSVRAFGVIGDGLADETVKLQRAIDQLFVNPATVGSVSSRRQLHLPAGAYVISNSLKLPPFTTLIGAGSDKTVITQTGNFPVFETVNGLRTPGVAGNRAATTTLNQARHIAVNGMTLNITGNNTAILVDNCVNSDFEDIKIVGDWDNSAGYTDNYAISLLSLSTAVASTNNNFRSIKINQFQQAVHSDYDVSENHLENCVFQNCEYGVVFGENTTLGSPGQNTAPINNTISKCQFLDINRQGIWIRVGRGNKSISNSFYSVGNNGGTESNAVFSVIKFESMENASHNDYFDRTKKLSTESAFLLTAAYAPEIEGFVDNTNTYSLLVNVSYTASFTNSFRLPADATKSYIVYYIYKSTYVNAVRHGQLEITVNRNNDTTSLTDTYDYVGDPSYTTSLDFKVILSDIDADTNVDTVLVQTRDSILNDQATILFQIKTQS
jgi:hypothetical protein